VFIPTKAAGGMSSATSVTISGRVAEASYLQFVCTTGRGYIRQVNQTYYDVQANSLSSAMSKAQKEWEKENGPTVMSVEGE
jgi:urocanate hydratase